MTKEERAVIRKALAYIDTPATANLLTPAEQDALAELAREPSDPPSAKRAGLAPITDPGVADQERMKREAKGTKASEKAKPPEVEIPSRSEALDALAQREQRFAATGDPTVPFPGEGTAAKKGKAGAAPDALSEADLDKIEEEEPLPKVAELEAFLEGKTEGEVLALQARDHRVGAQAIYSRWLDEFEAEHRS